MKIKKLDIRGFSHDIVIVLIVVVFAIGGVAYLVASKADSCIAAPVSGTVSEVTSAAVSDTASGVVSTPNCPVVSAPVTAPVTAPVNNPPTPTPTPPPVTTPPVQPRPNGTVKIITYKNSVKPGNQIGGVTIKIGQGGSGIYCTARTGTTSLTPGATLGQTTFTCPSAVSGGPLAYRLQAVTLKGYHVNGNSPHIPGNTSGTFRVSADKTTTLSIVLKR